MDAAQKLRAENRLPGRRSRIAVVASAALLLLGACASSEPTSPGAFPSSAGSIELAVADACADTAVDGCTATAGDSVILASDFERVGVTDAVAVDEGGDNAIALTLTSDGAAVLTTLTEQVVAAGPETRLVVKIGDDVLSAVRVVEALQTDVVVVALPPSESPNEVIELIRAG